MTFDNHERPSRSLTFPLREDLVLDAADNADGAITKVTADFFPTDPDEKIDVTFNLSFNEFTAIASSIDIGRDIGYGEQSALIWWTWIRSLKGIGDSPVSCEDIADCIETDESVQTALVQNLLTTEMINQITTVVNNSGFGNPNSINTALTTVVDRNPLGALQEEIKPLADCNLDALWGGIREGIVSRLNDLTKDLLEDLLIIPDVAERLTVFIDVVPVIGDLIEGVAFQITEIIPDLYTLYESYESSETLDELACEIFSIVCSECRYPTFEELFGVYAGHTLIGLAMNDLTLDAVATAVLDLLTQTAEVSFFTLSIQALFVLNLQSAYNGASGTKSIIKWAELGEDSTSDNWLTLCDSCDDTYRIFTLDFSTGMHESYKDGVTVTGAVYFAGEGWRAGVYGAGKRGDICIKWNPDWKIRGVGMQIVGATPSSTIFYRRPTWQSNTGVVAPSAGTTCGDYTKAWDGYAGVSGYNEILFFWQGGVTDIMTLKKISIICDNGFSPPTAIPTTDGTIC